MRNKNALLKAACTSMALAAFLLIGHTLSSGSKLRAELPMDEDTSSCAHVACTAPGPQTYATCADSIITYTSRDGERRQKKVAHCSWYKGLGATCTTDFECRDLDNCTKEECVMEPGARTGTCQLAVSDYCDDGDPTTEDICLSNFGSGTSETKVAVACRHKQICMEGEKESGDECEPDLCYGVTCAASDSCHMSMCDQSTGECVESELCPGQNCIEGSCMDKCAMVNCAAEVGVCEIAGVCDSNTGECSEPIYACSDVEECTESGCSARCTPDLDESCKPRNGCYSRGCDGKTGACSNEEYICGDGETCEYDPNAPGDESQKYCVPGNKCLNGSGVRSKCGDDYCDPVDGTCYECEYDWQCEKHEKSMLEEDQLGCLVFPGSRYGICSPFGVGDPAENQPTNPWPDADQANEEPYGPPEAPDTNVGDDTEPESTTGEGEGSGSEEGDGSGSEEPGSGTDTPAAPDEPGEPVSEKSDDPSDPGKTTSTEPKNVSGPRVHTNSEEYDEDASLGIQDVVSVTCKDAIGKETIYPVYGDSPENVCAVLGQTFVRMTNAMPTSTAENADPSPLETSPQKTPTRDAADRAAAPQVYELNLGNAKIILPTPSFSSAPKLPVPTTNLQKRGDNVVSSASFSLPATSSPSSSTSSQLVTTSSSSSAQVELDLQIAVLEAINPVFEERCGAAQAICDGQGLACIPTKEFPYVRCVDEAGSALGGSLLSTGAAGAALPVSVILACGMAWTLISHLKRKRS